MLLSKSRFRNIGLLLYTAVHLIAGSSHTNLTSKGWSRPRLWPVMPRRGCHPNSLRSKSVVKVATNLRKLRREREQKGEKRLAAVCCKLLLFSGLRRLRQDLANLAPRLEGRRSIQLSYGRSLPNFSYYNYLRYNLLCLFDRHFRYIRYN